MFLGGAARDRAGLLDGQHEIEGGEVVTHGEVASSIAFVNPAILRQKTTFVSSLAKLKASFG
jgi:hypothetical protein